MPSTIATYADRCRSFQRFAPSRDSIPSVDVSASGIRISSAPVPYHRYSRSTALEVGMEVHSRVEARDLIRVAVEHEGLAPARLTDPLLGRLAPPRVIVLGIHVAVEPVLGRRVLVPRVRWLLVGERDLHD